MSRSLFPVRPELVEGPLFSVPQAPKLQEGRPFDKLRANGGWGKTA